MEGLLITTSYSCNSNMKFCSPKWKEAEKIYSSIQCVFCLMQYHVRTGCKGKGDNMLGP